MTMDQQSSRTPIVAERRKPGRNPAVRIGAGCLYVMGVPMLVSGLIALIVADSPNDTQGAFAAVAFGGFFSTAGFMWVRWMRAREDLRIAQYHEKLVLDIAARHAGIVTVAQLSQATPLSVAEVDATLERLARQGLATVELLEDGGVVYRFAGLGPLRLDT